MSRAGDGFFSIAVTTLFVALLVGSGGIGIVVALPLVGCAAYRMRCSLAQLATYEHKPLGPAVTHH